MPEPETLRATEGVRERRHRFRTLALILAIALVVTDLALQHVALADDEFLRRRVAPYDPPIFCATQRDALARLDAFAEFDQSVGETVLHHPELGWSTPRDTALGEMLFDEHGARTSGVERGEPSADRRRIVTVGCSFTLGTEVLNGETWQAALEELRADVELVNLGVMGYGTDQALLRYVRDGRPLAPDEVWLGFLPTASQRVTTNYRPAHLHWGNTILFKPRFVLDEAGALELVPNPGPDLRETHRLLHDQDAFLAATSADSWVRRYPAAWLPRGASVLHHSGIARVLLTALESSGRDPLRALAEHDDETHRITRALCLRLRDEAAADGARFRLVILPGADDLADFRAHARPSWADWADGLAREGVVVLDLSSRLDERDRAEPGVIWAPNGHYTARANRWVGEALAAELDAPLER